MAHFTNAIVPTIALVVRMDLALITVLVLRAISVLMDIRLV